MRIWFAFQASSRSRQGNNRTKENRLSQLWLVGKDPIDLFDSFPSFREEGSNRAEVVHFLGRQWAARIGYLVREPVNDSGSRARSLCLRLLCLVEWSTHHLCQACQMLRDDSAVAIAITRTPRERIRYITHADSFFPQGGNLTAPAESPDAESRRSKAATVINAMSLLRMTVARSARRR
jgi:hypothetical protein